LTVAIEGETGLVFFFELRAGDLMRQEVFIVR
jgi:hypothetical protein